MKSLAQWAVWAAVLLGAAITARAQVNVDINFSRVLYIRYEPLLCTVTITNNSGRTLDLEDTPRDKWFSFQLETEDGRPLPPNDPDYHNDPMHLESGQKLSRTVNLAPLFPLGEYGTVRVRAAVHAPQLDRYFSSPQLSVEITEGREIWQQTVGVPDGSGEGRTRKYTLLSHRLSRTTVLYLRVEDPDNGIIFCTTQLGRFIPFGLPDVQLDTTNNIHILQNSAPKTFLYTVADLNGKVQSQSGFQSTNTRPSLTRNNDGSVSVVGGAAYDPNATPPEKQVPTLSDRPVPLPKPPTGPTPRSKDAPVHLLSQ